MAVSRADRPAEAPDTLLGLLARYSPSGAEGEAAAWLVDHMRGLGFKTTFIDAAGNAVGIMGEGEQQILLLGHIDTVPGEVVVRVEGDLLYGRGAVDAKGPLSAFVEAAARIGPRPGWQFIVIGAVDEERQSLGARHVVKEYSPDYAIIGEPSGWNRCTLGYKGCANAEVRLQRSQVHSASEYETAPEAAIQLWDMVSEWAAHYNAGRERPFDQLLISLNDFSSGTDGFHAWAKLSVGARLPVDLAPQVWFGILDQLCTPAEVKPAGYPIPAFKGEKNTPLVRAFLAGIRAGGGKPGFVLKTGTADLNIVAPVWDCPCLAYGPGDSALDHTANEHISLSEYRLAVDVLEEVLLRLTQELEI